MSNYGVLTKTLSLYGVNYGAPAKIFRLCGVKRVSYFCRSFLRTLLCIFCLFGSIYHFKVACDDSYISDFTQHVYQRYYFIKRLKKTVNILKKIHESKISILPIDFGVSFRHTVALQCIHQMNTKKSLAPLVSFWGKIRAFKWVEEVTLIEEFIRIVFIISKELFCSIATGNFSKIITIEDSETFATEKMLDAISVYTDLFLYKQHSKVVPHNMYIGSQDLTIQDEIVFSGDYQESVGILSILLRHYFINRLKRMFAILRYLKKKKVSIFNQEKLKRDMLLFVDGNVSHKWVKFYIKKVIGTKDIKPLLQLHDDFIHFRFVRDVLFLKDFLRTLLMIGKIVLLQYRLKASQGFSIPSITEFNEWYGYIKGLSSEELLQKIDIVVEKMLIVIEHK